MKNNYPEDPEGCGIIVNPILLAQKLFAMANLPLPLDLERRAREEFIRIINEHTCKKNGINQLR